ncbi:MAG: DNA polymerase I [Fibrobacteraceae bacterium]|nr:DNA polymerase I [Fibrobacteraceae bacterium]
MLDSYALAFRMFYAYAKTPLINKDNVDVSLVHGYWGAVLRILAKHKPTHFAIVRDVSAPTFRHDLYPEYKANRGAMPEEMARQMPLLIETLEASGIPLLAENGYEADDVMSGVADVAYKEGFEQIFLLTKDKDLCQIVNDRVHLFHLEKGADGIDFGPEQVKEKYGVPPEQIRDYLALMGDSSDNVPGVVKVGPKTAMDLLGEFGNIDNLYANLDKVTKKSLRDNLEKGKENAFLSRELVTLQASRGFKGTLDQLEFRGLESDALAKIFKANEINSLLRLLETVPSRAGFSEELPRQKLKPLKTVLVQNTETFESMKSSVSKCESPALYVAKDGENPMTAVLVGVSVAVSEEKAFYVPFAHTDDIGFPLENFDLQTFKVWFVPTFCDAQKEWRMFAAKTDLHILSNAFGIKLVPIKILDSQIASWMLSPGETKYELDDLVVRRLGDERATRESVVGHGKNEIPFVRISLADATAYFAKSAALVYSLWDNVREELEKRGSKKCFDNLEMPMLRILFQMEEYGVAINSKVLIELSKVFSTRIERIEEKIYDLAGGKPFNIASPKQLAEVLFDDLKLSTGKKSEKSTSAAVLDQLSIESPHPIIDAIFEYRELKKLQNTYVDVLPTLVNPKTHRIHTNFVQWGTATGRLSSRDPNLQNIPVRSEEGKKIRAAFIPGSADKVILSVDYSQIELRMLAHLSKDPKLTEAYKLGADIHTQTAAAVYGKDPSQVTADERRNAKVINFGVLYGMTSFRLARDLRISRTEAQMFINGYFNLYSGVKEFEDRVTKFVREHGYVETITGRRRVIPGIDSHDHTERLMAERMAVNTPVQGSAADLIKMAMIRVATRIEKEKLPLEMILQVHDELVFECPADRAEELGAIVKKEMENAMILDVPLVASVGFGKDWLEAH